MNKTSRECPMRVGGRFLDDAMTLTMRVVAVLRRRPQQGAIVGGDEVNADK